MKSIIKSGSPKNVENRLKVRRRQYWRSPQARSRHGERIQFISEKQRDGKVSQESVPLSSNSNTREGPRRIQEETNRQNKRHRM